MKRLIYTSLLAVVLLISVPALSLGATLTGGETYDLRATEIVDDNLYVAAGDLTISGVIQGDLLAAGGTLVVSGGVRDDLLAAGGNVTVLGPVGEDARVVGGNLLIDSEIGGDLSAAGGTIKTLDTVTVGRDISLAGGLVTLNGTVAGDATIAGGNVTINGTIEGDVLVEVGETLTLGDTARIGGTLVYRGNSKEALVVQEGAVITGETIFRASARPAYEAEDVERGLAALFGVLYLLKLLMVIVAAIVLTQLFKRFSHQVVTHTLQSFWLQALRGFIVFVMIPVTAIMLFMTIFGLYLGLILLALYALVLMLTGIYSGVVFGATIMKTLKKETDISLSWWRVTLGIILLSLVKLVPIVGWAIALLFWLATLGAFFQLFRERVWQQR